jgi:hypothetical protein
MAAVAPSTDLKRLAFVETAAANSVDFVTGTKVFSKACGYYSSAKETNALKGSLTKIEDLIKAYGTPVVSKVQEKYPAYMTTVDAKVDTAVTLLQSIWADKIAPSAPVAYAKSALALTPEKLEELKATREAYFAKIENTLALLRAKAVALPEKVTAAVTAAIAEARAQVDNAQLFEKVKAAYETVLKYPAVVAVLERAAPAAAKAADAAKPYVAKAAAFAEPYVAAVKTKVMPGKKTVEQLD